ncbi:hypothetical protein [Streptomyces radiopugnans]|nr:hypothetical protein [Streptomyces radiopugnans]
MYKHEHTSADGKTHTTILDQPVSAWGEDGTPFVASQNGLVPAWDIPGFSYVTGVPSPTVSLLPADGWRIQYLDGPNKGRSEPLVGWKAKADGTVEPLILSGEGSVVEAYIELDDGAYRIYHPSTEES